MASRSSRSRRRERESLRQEARRRGVSLYQVRIERGQRAGVAKRASVGHGAAVRQTTARGVFALSPSQNRARRRADEAVRLMRTRGYSLDKAARRAHTTPDAVRRWAGPALAQTPKGRWQARATDRLVRVMPVVSGGVVYERVAVRGSRDASTVSAHLRAVNRFFEHGLDDDLRTFAGVVVEGTLPDGRTKVAFELETTVDVLLDLDRLGTLDDLVVES